MRIDKVQENYNTGFKAILLGNGGAKRLAETMPVLNAKRLIERNTFVKNDILICKDTVEILPQNKMLILKVSDKIAGSKNFTDVEIFEHGDRHVFKLEPGLSEEEINKYGSRNRQISLAEAIAKKLDFCDKWLEKISNGNDGKEVRPSIEQAAKEIDLFNKTYFTFD